MTRIPAVIRTAVALAAAAVVSVPLVVAGPVVAAEPVKDTSKERTVNDRAKNNKYEGPRRLISKKQRSAIDLRRVQFKYLKAGGAKIVFTVNGPLPRSKAARKPIMLEAMVAKEGSYEAVMVAWTASSKRAVITRSLDATRERTCRVKVKVTKKRKAFKIVVPKRCTWSQGDHIDAQMNAFVRKGTRQTFAHNRIVNTANMTR